MAFSHTFPSIELKSTKPSTKVNENVYRINVFRNEKRKLLSISIQFFLEPIKSDFHRQVEKDASSC